MLFSMQERQELGRRAMMRTLAPQTTASFVYLMNNGKHPGNKTHVLCDAISY